MVELINRRSAVDGRFYPSDKDELNGLLKELFSNTERDDSISHANAIIAPHAGYIYSGEVAANAFAQIDPNTIYENIFVLAPSHQVSFNGASVYNIGNYETPLGEVPVNIDLANKIIKKSSNLGFYKDAHRLEHSLEVQLPFLQYWLKHKFKLVPIIFGTQDIETIKLISSVLEPYFTKSNLFVISSDFSHFPNYTDAIKADTTICDAILSKQVKAIQKATKQNKKAHYNNLATSACGIAGIYCLMYLLQQYPTIDIKKIMYKNSGDSKYGDHSRVVGYLSFVIHSNSDTNKEFRLNTNNKKQLLKLARNAIENKLGIESTQLVEEQFGKDLQTKCGVFVSLHSNGKLRGCIGRFITDDPLYKLVKTMAVSAAFQDSRFNPVTLDELKNIEIEISVLSPLQEITDPNEIIVGKHGIYIEQGYQKGTLLPQVAVNNNWSVEEFLSYCSKHKTGIDWDGWKTAKLFTYTAEIFSE